MTTDPSIIFMGTPDFAVPALQTIHHVYPIRAVVTVPDKPKGRGLQVQASAVKRAALELGIHTILQPESLKDPNFAEQLKVLQPDIIVVIAFRILPKSIFSLAKLATFNIHGSLLPKFRGAAPINWTIIVGETLTGVTAFVLDENIDTGGIVGRRFCEIPDGMTAGELHDALQPMAAELSLKTCRHLLEGTAIPEPQNHEIATKAPKIFRETCRIQWNNPATTVRQTILGLSPYPGAWTTMPDGKTLKLLRAYQADPQKYPSLPVMGEYRVHNDILLAGCADFALEITEVQPEGKRPMPIRDFIHGFRGEKHGKFE